MSVSVACFPFRTTAAKRLWRQVFSALCLAAVACIVLPAAAWAQSLGDLGVSPTRVVLAGRTRSAEIVLLNRGTQPATYRISVVNMRMTETGRFETIEQTESDQMFADKLIRYAPRQVTLDPGATQTVRVMVRKPRDLPPGEYRSHLYFRAVPPPGAGRSVEFVDSGQGIQINLVVIPGVTIQDRYCRRSQMGRAAPWRLRALGDVRAHVDWEKSVDHRAARVLVYEAIGRIADETDSDWGRRHGRQRRL